MMLGRSRAYLAIFFSFFFAFCLLIWPMPTWFAVLQPNWVWLVLIFWGLAVPRCVGLGTAWCLGLLVDVLLGHLLGEHAFVFLCTQYMVMRFRPQIRQYALFQQWLVVLALLLLGYVVLFFLQGTVAQLPPSHRYWLQPLVAALCWPWLDILLKLVQKHYQAYHPAELD